MGGNGVMFSPSLTYYLVHNTSGVELRAPGWRLNGIRDCYTRLTRRGWAIHSLAGAT